MFLDFGNFRYHLIFCSWCILVLQLSGNVAACYNIILRREFHRVVSDILAAT